MAVFHQGAVDVQCDSMTHHHVRELLGVRVRSGYVADVLALAQNGHPVGDFHHLVELVGDDDHGLAVGLHVTHDVKETVRLLGGQDGGGLVQYENVRTAVEDFDDLHRLLFRDGHIIDFLGGVNDKAVFFADLLDLGGGGFQVQPLLTVQAQDDIFSRSEHIHQLEVLMDHADAAVKGIFGGGDGDALAVYQNFTLVGEIDAGQHVHEGGFAAAVFAQQRQDLTALDVQRDMVVCHDLAEALGDVFHLDGIGLFQANLPSF